MDFPKIHLLLSNPVTASSGCVNLVQTHAKIGSPFPQNMIRIIPKACSTATMVYPKRPVNGKFRPFFNLPKSVAQKCYIIEAKMYARPDPIGSPFPQNMIRIAPKACSATSMMCPNRPVKGKFQLFFNLSKSVAQKCYMIVTSLVRIIWLWETVRLRSASAPGSTLTFLQTWKRFSV